MKALSPQQIARLKKMHAAAQQARQGGHAQQAAQLLQDILKEAPEAHDVRHQLAVLLATSGKPQEAVRQFRLLVKANPAHAAAHANLGNALLEAGELQEAVVELQRALALDDKLIGARLALASALRRLGRSTEAIEHYRQVLERDRVNHVAFNGMGLAYRDLNDMPRALECLEHAVGLAPDNAEYRINFGVTLERHELEFEAVEQYYKAVQLQPRMLEAMVFLGNVLDKSRRFDEALECFEQAKKLHPDELELEERIGYVYLGMGAAEKALEFFEQALQQDGTREMAWRGVGQAHQDAGKFDLAIATADKLIEMMPASPLGYTLKSRVTKVKAGDPLPDQLQNLLQEAQLTPEQTTVIEFALGKIYDDFGQPDLAFKHYAAGNRLVMSLSKPYVPSKDTERFERLMRVYSKEFFERHADCGIASDVPLLIVGMPRSGTTLTEQILSSHPQVIGGGEAIFWSRSPRAVPMTLKSKTLYPECMLEITPEKAHQIAEKYLHHLYKIAGPDAAPARITDKMPHNFTHLGLIALLFPNAKIIHCRRDPMDTCLSIFFQHFGGTHSYAYDLAHLGHHYKLYQRLMAHWHEVLPGRIMDVTYERTIADPEYWSRALIDFVGLPWDDACLAPHKLERSVKTASHWQVRQPIYKTSVARWKKYEPFLGPLKEALDYRD